MVNISDEKSIIEHCRKKNRHAQKILFDTHFPKMLPVCLRYLKNDHDALEVLNNAFLKVFDKIKQYKAEGNLESWIKRIVINSSIDFVRSNRLYRENFIHTNEFHLYGEPREEDISPDDWEEDTTRFSKEDLLAMVGDLPPATRIVFNLYVIDDFTHKQISENLKISEGTSKWHLSNGRKILREKINQAVAVKNKNKNHGEEKIGRR